MSEAAEPSFEVTMQATTTTCPEPEFAIVEIMGHRRYGARVSEVQKFGATFLRADVLTEPPFTQYVPPGSIFALTTCSEEQARKACRYTDAPQELRPERALPARAESREQIDDGTDEESEDIDLEEDDIAF